MRVDKLNAGRFSSGIKPAGERENIYYLPSAVTKGIIAIVRARLIATVNSLW